MVIVCTKVAPQDISFLNNLGASLQKVSSPYELIRYTYKDAVFILYKSGKLVIQAKQPLEEELKRLCAKHNLLIQHKNMKPSLQKQSCKAVFADCIIGSDETLKGDTFGGLVVVGALFCKKQLPQLLSYGVKDSKLLSDRDCQTIATRLRKEFPHNFVVKNLFPKEYNNKQSTYSSTQLLNTLHAQVGENLKKIAPQASHVVDKFPGCTAGDVAVTKAESAYLQVAAASIVARAIAIEQFEELSSRAGFILPKGSTHVAQALKKIVLKGLKKDEFVKLHFKNVK
ncbi:MAG: hypothetical protein ACOCQQ_02965 [Candidatus Nanoarchaeia archaeon]